MTLCAHASEACLAGQISFPTFDAELHASGPPSSTVLHPLPLPLRPAPHQASPGRSKQLPYRNPPAIVLESQRPASLPDPPPRTTTMAPYAANTAVASRKQPRRPMNRIVPAVPFALSRPSPSAKTSTPEETVTETFTVTQPAAEPHPTADQGGQAEE